MKLNEKWTLFLIATFVTFFGITNTLLKGTEATDETDNETSYVSDYSELGSSNCDLTDIILSEGTIDFSSSVTEYSIKVSDFESLSVTPVRASDSSIYIIDKNLDQNGHNSVVISVYAENGNVKVYTLYIEEISNE